MAKQTFTSGQTLTAAQMNDLQTNDFNLSVSTQTANYTLQASDKGTREVMNMGSAGTVTVPNSVFNAGDALWVHSIGSGTISLVAGTGMTLNSSAGTAPTLAQWEGGVVYFTSASSSIFFRGGGVGNANFSDAATGTYSSGGTSYKYITYTASGTLTITKAGFADILVVAGGAGGGSFGGGGGAGGHLYVTDAYLPAGTLTVTVGAGGAGDTTGGNARGGNASRLGDYYSVGGGNGGTCNYAHLDFGRAGGSGGGGANNAAAGGAGVTGLGNDGGAAQAAANHSGGGGGASAVGAAGAGGNGGNGGAGTSTSLDNSATTRAGGGGGGSQGGTAGTGGAGGGGNGTNSSTNGSPGSVNTGGGGGGSGAGGNGGAGGSGIVIVRVKT